MHGAEGSLSSVCSFISFPWIFVTSIRTYEAGLLSAIMSVHTLHDGFALSWTPSAWARPRFFGLLACDLLTAVVSVLWEVSLLEEGRVRSAGLLVEQRLWRMGRSFPSKGTGRGGGVTGNGMALRLRRWDQIWTYFQKWGGLLRLEACLWWAGQGEPLVPIKLPFSRTFH